MLCVVFVVSLMGFDQTLWEDNRQNSLDEAAALFDSICNMERFQSVPFVLLFTKKGKQTNL